MNKLILSIFEFKWKNLSKNGEKVVDDLYEPLLDPPSSPPKQSARDMVAIMSGRNIAWCERFMKAMGFTQHTIIWPLPKTICRGVDLRLIDTRIYIKNESNLQPLFAIICWWCCLTNNPFVNWMTSLLNHDQSRIRWHRIGHDYSNDIRRFLPRCRERTHKDYFLKEIVSWHDRRRWLDSVRMGASRRTI